MEITLSRRRVVLCLLAAVLLFTLTGIAVQILRYVYGFDYQWGLYSLLNLGADASIPTWYASLALLFCSALLAMIARVKQRQRDRFARHWWLLFAIFFVLSIDETARIHETLGKTAEINLIGDTEGFFHYSWVILGMIFLAVFVLSYIRFLVHLPNWTRWWFVISGALYTGGALGFEMISANYIGDKGYDLAAQSIIIVEEVLEMLGVVAFANTLLVYLMRHLRTITIHIAAEHHAQPPNEAGIR